MSAVVVDTVNKLVRTPGSLGDTQGWHVPLLPPPPGVIGMQVAMRYWFDSFTHEGPVTPYSRGQNAGQVAYSVGSVNWEHLFALGLGFTPDQPVRNASTGGLPNTSKGFFGIVTGRRSTDASATHHAVVVRTSPALANIALWVTHEASVGFLSEMERAILHHQTRASSALFASSFANSTLGPSMWTTPGIEPFDTSAIAWLDWFPANPVDGAKFTIGMEFRKRSGGGHQVDLRVFVDSRSIPEDDLLDVFDSYEVVSGTTQINRSSSGIDGDDAWIDDSGNLVLPGYFLHRNGLPGQAFVVKPIKYRYLTP